MSENRLGLSRLAGLLLGPGLFALVLLAPLPEGMPLAALRVAAVAVWMAVWWATEAVPIPATALLPIALFPLLGVLKASEVTGAYANHLIYLFMGGFLIAIAMVRWNLHKRIALSTINLVGIGPTRIVFGFMLATAVLSMWVSNTATTMMMVPIAIAVVNQAFLILKHEPGEDLNINPGQFNFGIALMLGIAYAASIGGVATLIGTPPNAIMAGVIENTYGYAISFAQWMAIGLPLASVFLVLAWFYLTRIAYPIEISSLPGGKELISSELRKLGAMSWEEKGVLAVFLTVAIAWIARGVLKPAALNMVADSTIAIVGALTLFVIPSDFKRGKFLLDWATAVKIPWDIIVLFGGGFALANGFSHSGLTGWVGQQISVLEGFPIIIIVISVALLVVFLTELTSNTATASLFVPIMAVIAGAMQVHPFGLMITAAVASSYAFMLPVATPPNAIVFGSRYVTIPQMAKAGFWLNIIACVLITLAVGVMMPLLWSIELNQFPAGW